MDYMDTPEWVIEMSLRVEEAYRPPEPAPLQDPEPYIG